MKLTAQSPSTIRGAVVALLTIACSAAGAPSMAAAERTPVTLGHYDGLRSEVLEEDRELLVYLPPRYEETVAEGGPGYPVLYIMDGRPNFSLTVGAVHGLAESQAIPRMIVVGIANTNRWRDLTPTRTADHPDSGGGDAFLRFVRDELIPYVDGEYHTGDYRLFSGFSLGGLMVVHALTTMPDIFDAYLAGSPSFEWDEARQADALIESLRRHDRLDAHLHLFLGDERSDRDGYLRLVRGLEVEAPPGFTWDSTIDTTVDHLGTRVPRIVDALRSVYREWDLPSERIIAMSDEEIDAFYAEATRRYGTPRSLSFNRLLEAGYYGLYQRSTAPRGLALLERLAAENPNNPYAVDSYGEGLERTGDVEAALAQFEKAYPMAVEQEWEDLGYFKSHLDRARRTLGLTE